MVQKRQVEIGSIRLEFIQVMDAHMNRAKVRESHSEALELRHAKSVDFGPNDETATRVTAICRQPLVQLARINLLS